MQMIHPSHVGAFASYQIAPDHILAQRAQLRAESATRQAARRTGSRFSRWFDRKARNQYLDELGVRQLVDRL
jgi:hypothetical protein